MSVIDGEKLEYQHLLLDTCFIIKAYEYREERYFEELFLFLQKHRCIPVINEFVKFEFLRGCQTPEHIRLKNAFLSFWAGMVLPINPNIFEDATSISNIYSNKNIDTKQINVVDCCLSAYLKTYSSKLLLATFNHKDFPLLVHDRVEISLIDTEKEILALGFYKFNSDKYNKLMLNFK